MLAPIKSMAAAGGSNQPVTTLFVSTGSSLVSVNVSDLSSPTKISEVSADLNGGRLVYSKKRNHVFVTTKGDNEIVSIDVSDPSFMSVSQTMSISGEAGALALDNDNDVLYWTRADSGYIYSYDVSTPSSMAQLDVITSTGLTSSVSMALSIDFANKRLLASAGKIVTNGFHRLSLIDISNPASMVKLNEVTKSIDEVNGNYSKVALDVKNKTVYWSTERYTQSHSYAGDAIGSGSSAGDNGSSFGLSYFRGRDDNFFDGELTASGYNLTAFDDYRLAGFTLINSSPDDLLQIYDLSDPSAPAVLGSLSDAAFSPVGDAVANTSSPSCNFSYK
jgi:hypothetical protein